jgi:hypothetical protein
MTKRDNGLPRNDGGTSGMQGANLSGHGTRNGTAREDGSLDSEHEGWLKREDGLPRSDRGQYREDEAESRNDAVHSRGSESPYGRG